MLFDKYTTFEHNKKYYGKIILSNTFLVAEFALLLHRSSSTILLHLSPICIVSTL